MKPLLFLMLLTPVPAFATELWCMPDKICYGTDCGAQFDEESSLRLTNPDGPAPSLRSYAEDIAMIKTRDAETVQWEGVNAEGIPEILAMNPSSLRFTYLIGTGPEDYKATGLCEVQ
jgi:hypothetical protein